MHYYKTLYHERLQAGVCVYCGKNKSSIAPDGTVMSSCEECREKRNELKRRYRAKKRKKLISETDPVELYPKKTPCKACRVNINVLYYYCPWCGAKQEIGGIENG